MTQPHNRKLKIITFTIESVEFQCQLSMWKMNNNTEDGEKFYTFCGPGEEGEFREDAEGDWSLDLKWFADWRSGGLNDYLASNDQVRAGFQLDHHPDILGEHVRWTGDLKLKAPSVGGEARTTETTEITLPIFGVPAYTRP